jgi:hypothetical protein
MSDDGFPDVDTVKYENTYIMKPEDYGEVRPARWRPPRSRTPRRARLERESCLDQQFNPFCFWNRVRRSRDSSLIDSLPPSLDRSNAQGYKFMRGPVQKVLSETIKERLHDTTYDPLKSAQIAKELADTIKERVKNLNFTRYKLVVQVTVGEKTGQAIRLASRCLWDTATDNFASDFYENSSVFCVAMVFGLYYE